MVQFSSETARRSWSVFPDGSLGEYNLPPELSIVLSRGQGARVWDSSNREYVDYTMGWGSVLLGHAHPAVVEAVQKQAASGSNFAYVSEPALLLAEELTRAVPCAQKVRFCASGTEATMYAVRFARAFTGRNKIIKFEGAYHGANEFGAISLFPPKLLDFPTPNPTSAGVTPAVCQDVLIAPYNDLVTTSQIVATHADDLAAIIVEPLHRCTIPVPGFLQGLRDLTRKYGLLLVFDECVTGFRLAYGGAQEYYGVIPDLAALGKALGGGYPVGAVVGRADILDLCRESALGSEKYVWYASTLGGNPITSVAALETLKTLRQPGTYPQLFDLGARLRQGLRDILDNLGLTAQVLGDGPLCAVSFTAQTVTDYRSAFRADKDKARALVLGLFQNGIFLNPMSTKFYLSLAHGPAELEAMLSAAHRTLAAIAGR